MTPALQQVLKAGDDLVSRLRILERLQMQARERGESTYELHVEELIEPADLRAILAWEAAKLAATGQQPLPMELSA